MSTPHNTEHDSTGTFDLVSNEIRVGILRALAERRREAPRAPTLAFADLRRRVGTRDSGKFNYHLNQLRGHFVEQTDAGYKLTYPGLKLVSAIVAGTYEIPEQREPVEIDESCPVCGDPLTAAYEDGLFRVNCSNNHTFQNAIPPSVTEGRTIDENIDLLTLRSQQDLELAVKGICPLCHGRVEWSLRRLEEADVGPMFESTCSRCGMHIDTAIGPCVIRHPAVVSFYYDHGIDIRTEPYWTLAFCTDDPLVLSEDPLELRIDIQVERDELRLTLDDSPSVIKTEYIKRDQ